MLTEAYQCLLDIDTESDLEVSLLYSLIIKNFKIIIIIII